MTPCLSKELWPALYIYMHLFEPFKKTAFVVVLAIVKTEKTHEKKKKNCQNLLNMVQFLIFRPIMTMCLSLAIFLSTYLSLVRGENANTVITFRYLNSWDYCCYYSLSVYAVMVILDYYPNLYASLNNAVINIYKLK